jgi:hypothetical protein
MELVSADLCALYSCELMLVYYKFPTSILVSRWNLNPKHIYTG